MDNSTHGYRNQRLLENRKPYAVNEYMSNDIQMSHIKNTIMYIDGYTEYLINTSFSCTVISWDMFMTNKWLPVNCTENHENIAFICERTVEGIDKVISRTGRTPWLMNSEVDMCLDGYSSVDNHCLTIESSRMAYNECTTTRR